MSRSRSLLPVKYAPTQRQLIGSGTIGTIYVVHFAQPLAHARHYIGWTQNLPARMSQHRAGYGGRLMAAVQAAGIDWTVSYTELGDRYRERQLKNQSSAARRFCWLCKVEKLIATSGFTPHVLTDRRAHVVYPLVGTTWQSICCQRVRRDVSQILWLPTAQQPRRPWCSFCLGKIRSLTPGIGLPLIAS